MVNVKTYTVETSSKSRLVHGRTPPHEAALNMSPDEGVPSF